MALSLGTLYAQLELQANNFKKGVSEANASMENIAKSIDKLNSTIESSFKRSSDSQVKVAKEAATKKAQIEKNLAKEREQLETNSLKHMLSYQKQIDKEREQIELNTVRHEIAAGKMKIAELEKAEKQRLSNIKSRNAKIKKSFDSTWKGIKSSISGAISNIISKFFSLKTAIIGSAAALVTMKIVNISAQFEGLYAAMVAVTGSSKDATKEFKFVQDQAMRLGMDVEGLTTEYTRLMAATKGTALEGVQTKKIFVSISEAMRVLQLSSDDANGAFRALVQMVSKGNIQAEEVRRQFGERMPGAFEMAAKAMGVTASQMDKMLRLGQVKAVQLLPALADAMIEKYGKGVPLAANSARAAFAKLNNELLLIANSVGKAGLLDAAKYVAGEAIKYLDAAKQIFTQLTPIINKMVHNFFDVKGPQQYYDVVSSLLSTILHAAASLIDAFEKLANVTIPAITSAFDSIVDVMSKIEVNGKRLFETPDQKMQRLLVAKGEELRQAQELLEQLQKNASHPSYYTDQGMARLNKQIVDLIYNKIPKLRKEFDSLSKTPLASDNNTSFVSKLADGLNKLGDAIDKNKGKKFSFDLGGGAKTGEDFKKTTASIAQLTANYSVLLSQTGNLADATKVYANALKTIPEQPLFKAQDESTQRSIINGLIKSYSNWISEIEKASKAVESNQDPISKLRVKMEDSKAKLQAYLSGGDAGLAAMQAKIAGDTAEAAVKAAMEGARVGVKKWSDAYVNVVADSLKINSGLSTEEKRNLIEKWASDYAKAAEEAKQELKKQQKLDKGFGVVKSKLGFIMQPDSTSGSAASQTIAKLKAQQDSMLQYITDNEDKVTKVYGDSNAARAQVNEYFNKKIMEQTDSLYNYLRNSGKDWASSFADTLLDTSKSFKDWVHDIMMQIAKLTLMKSLQPQFDYISNAIANLYSSFGSFGGGKNSFFSNIGSMISSAFGFAKGGAFSGGIQKFATGAVVSSPTMFPMANGMGLMGEAGPEAVMPLTRDSKGNLGVSVSGSSSNQPMVIEQHFHINQAMPGMEQLLQKAAADGAQKGYSLVANDIKTRGPIRRTLG